MNSLVGWGADLAEALAALHVAGRVHGDVRAELVRMTSEGRAVLEPAWPGAPPKHPAPEGGPSPAADVYALGAVLHGAGGGADPRLAELWGWLGHPDPAQRPTAAQVATRLRQLATTPTPAPVAASGGNARKRWMALLTVVALLAAGAAGWWLTRPKPAPGPPPAPAWADPIGDPRTADPCALLDPAAFGRFGTPRRYPDLGLPSACLVQIQVGSGGEAWVNAGISNPSKDDLDLPATASRPLDGMTVYLISQTPGACGRVLLLPDRYRVIVYAFADATTPVDLCALADTGVDSARAALRAPSLPRRPLTEPSNSLVWIGDACSLGDDGALRAVPGLDASRSQRTMAGWQCVWGNDRARVHPPTVRVSLVNDRPPEPPTVTLAGRTASVPVAGSRECVVQLVQRSFTGAFGEPRVEALEVGVDLGDSPPPDASCPVLAARIAVAAANKLPQPS